MAKKVDLVRTQGAGTEHKAGYVGFSWLTFFFLWGVPLFKKDWKWVVIMFLVHTISSLLYKFLASFFIAFMSDPSGSESTILISLVVYLMVALPPRIFFDYVYNRKYTEKFIAGGFKPIDIFAAKILEESGLTVAPQSVPQSNSNTSGIRSRLATASTTPQNVGDLVKQGLALLECSEFGQAESLFEKALELNPKVSVAYIGVLMAEQKSKNVSQLVSCPFLLENDELFQEAMKCASPKMKQTLDKYVQLNRAKFNGGR